MPCRSPSSSPAAPRRRPAWPARGRRRSRPPRNACSVGLNSSMRPEEVLGHLDARDLALGDQFADRHAGSQVSSSDIQSSFVAMSARGSISRRVGRTAPGSRAGDQLGVCGTSKTIVARSSSEYGCHLGSSDGSGRRCGRTARTSRSSAEPLRVLRPVAGHRGQPVVVEDERDLAAVGRAEDPAHDRGGEVEAVDVGRRCAGERPCAAPSRCRPTTSPGR